MNCRLIADSGSTKTDWILLSENGDISEIHTSGINPVRDSRNVISDMLESQLLPRIHARVGEVAFYGAGCVPPFRIHVLEVMRTFFPTAEILVESDLLGAARALCGSNPGIVCILGTGSNSGYYDGRLIARNVPPLGYVLGDEGSGSVLGRLFLGMLLKDACPMGMKELFLTTFHLSVPDIIDRVYRGEQPNVFLASFMPFVHAHRSEPVIHELLISQFRLFLQRNVRAYGHPELPVSFAGSIASFFQSELAVSLEEEGLRLGEVVRSPSKCLLEYHQRHFPFTR